MKQLTKRILTAVIGTIVITIICASGIISSYSNALNDAIYQQEQTPDERITIIGIDDRAIEEFGPWPWSRDIIAQAIEYLNADPQAQPAVIGLDVVFDSTTTEQADEYLASVVSENDNVVVGAFAVFGNEIVENPDGTFHVDNYAVIDSKEPYPQLKEGADVGHVNTMLDSDGILRHAIWEIEFPDGTTMPAFNSIIAQKYAQITGLQITPPHTDSLSRWYVVQQSSPGSYSDGISVADLVNQTVSPQFFKDKIVLIGPYATGLQDEYKTPISPAENMYGVEYQANTIGALLANETKAEPISLQYVIVAIIAFLSFWFIFGKKFAISTLIWLIGCGAWLAICLISFNLGVVLHILYGWSAITTAYFVSIIQNYFQELKEKHRISFTFKRYVAPEIVSELLKNDPKTLELGGSSVDIAVLFADIRGFTAFSSTLPAQTVVEVINKILTVSSESILQNHGTLDKYIGDCTMAFWGAPLPQHDYIYNAVKTALELRNKLLILAEELQEQYGFSLGCGIGVNCGSAVVGNIGSPSRMDYTIIGNTVNAASRLEGKAKTGEVFVSKDVADALKGRVKFEYLGNNFEIKGLAKDFAVYKAISLIDE